MKGGVPSIVLSEILHMFLQSGKNICSGFFWVTGFFCGFYYNLRAGARLWVLLLSWGDNPRANPERLTPMRETTSLGGERAHQRCLFSPLPTVFSRALFSTLSPLFGETSACVCSQDFLRKTGSFPFCGASWKRAKHDRPPRGMGKKESGGLGEKTQKGKGDKHL